MRYKDVSKPLYEAVRYGNREKSYVLSNLNKFNFGVELEFDLPNSLSGSSIEAKILDPYRVVRECLLRESAHIVGATNKPQLQEYTDYTISQMNREVGEYLKLIQRTKKSATDDMYDNTQIKENFPVIINYIADRIRCIPLSELNLYFSIMLPVSPLNGNMVIENNPYFIEYIRQIRDNYSNVVNILGENRISGDLYGILYAFIFNVQFVLELLSEFPVDPTLEDIKRGKSLEERRVAVVDYVSGKLVEGVPNTDEEPFDIYECLSQLITKQGNITYYLKILERDFTGLVKVIQEKNITIGNAKTNTDIQSLSTNFDIVPEGTRQIEFISPTCTGKEITQCFSDMKKLTDIVISQKGTTSIRTGLHLSVSYNGDTSNFNALKFLLFSDSYRQILKPEHVRNYVQSITEDLLTSSMDIMIDDMTNNNISLSDALEKVSNKLSKKKYLSVNLGAMNASKGRVELRWPGGEGYEGRLDAYIDSAIRAMYALEIAYDPLAYRKEFIQNLFRLINKLWKDEIGYEAIIILPFLKKIKMKYPKMRILAYPDEIFFRMFNKAPYTLNSYMDLKTLEKELDQVFGDTTKDEI